MKLAISNIAWDAKDDRQIYNLMRKYQFSGVEIAPTRIFLENPYDRLKEASEWQKEIKKIYGFQIPSMQSIWFGRQERLFGTEEERSILFEYTKKAIDFAEKIQCKNLVFGCPRNRCLPEGADNLSAVSFFKEIGDYAFQHHTVVGMEANPTIYNTNYINDTASAIELIRQVDSNGFKLNLDIGTMIQNEESSDEIINYVRYINHVHISEPGLKRIEKRLLHNEIKRILTTENYDGYVSIEMGKLDDISEIEEVMCYVNGVFD